MCILLVGKESQKKDVFSFKIPKNTQLLEPDSEDDDIGNERVNISKNKFSNVCTADMQNIIKTENLIPPNMDSLCRDFKRLIVQSSTTQTWNRHCSSVKLFNTFCDTYGIKKRWPVSIELARAFTTWALTHRNLKSSTVKAYLSSLNTAHALSNIENANFNSDKCIKLALKGAENLAAKNSLPKPTRLAMNKNLLEILGHRMNQLEWSEFSKQVIWTACVVCFFTSCRMGELLAPTGNWTDNSTTLVWGNLKLMENTEYLMFIPFTKTKGFEGSFVDIFPIENKNICPVRALKKLQKMNFENKTWDLNRAVFSFKGGKNLTKNKLNEFLGNILFDFVDENNRITGHSFRAGIPSAIASYPDKSKISDILEWGRWEGKNSYKTYAKQDRAKKRVLFKKIVACL